MQKLEKVQVGLQEEEKIRNDLKDRYAAAIGEQKRCYSLMKAFQVSFFAFFPVHRMEELSFLVKFCAKSAKG